MKGKYSSAAVLPEAGVLKCGTVVQLVRRNHNPSKYHFSLLHIESKFLYFNSINCFNKEDLLNWNIKYN